MGFLNGVKVILERNRFFIPLSYALKKSGIVSFLHTMEYNLKKKEKLNREEEFRQYYSKQEKSFSRVYDALCDQESKMTYTAILDVLSGNDYRALKKHTIFPQYFPDNLLKKEMFDKEGVFVDGGAYIGDTIMEYIRFVDDYKKIYAWEPDFRNVIALKKNTRKYRNIEVIEKGMWNEKTILYFDQDGTDKSRVVMQSDNRIEADTIDNVCKTSDNVGLIKMDIEGAEYNALDGGRNTIKRSRPILAICIYHSFEDYWRIPLWIVENCEDYTISIRAHSDTASEAVVYGIPNERK